MELIKMSDLDKIRNQSYELDQNATPSNKGTLDGTAKKWDSRYRARRDVSIGKKASRNQGTGQQGITNTLPSKGISTSDMTPEEKAAYIANFQKSQRNESYIKRLNLL